jgi:hypothetical protein
VESTFSLFVAFGPIREFSGRGFVRQDHPQGSTNDETTTINIAKYPTKDHSDDMKLIL